jgi:hypothetical protein
LPASRASSHRNSLKINNLEIADQQSVTLTPYSIIFYQQFLAAQYFAEVATVSRAQLHENKDFRNQQEKNVRNQREHPNRKADREGLPDS